MLFQILMLRNLIPKQKMGFSEMILFFSPFKHVDKLLVHLGEILGHREGGSRVMYEK